ncbi:MAG: hypothetical protein RBU37_14620 [Myxococcota bacterium]|nr:hypothetical protein [Myxococcota bacterium]
MLDSELLPPSTHALSARILADANAPVAAAWRWLETGELELRVVNDGDFASLVVELFIDGSSLRSEPLSVPMAGVAQSCARHRVRRALGCSGFRGAAGGATGRGEQRNHGPVEASLLLRPPRILHTLLER